MADELVNTFFFSLSLFKAFGNSLCISYKTDVKGYPLVIELCFSFSVMFYRNSTADDHDQPKTTYPAAAGPHLTLDFLKAQSHWNLQNAMPTPRLNIKWGSFMVVQEHTPLITAFELVFVTTSRLWVYLPINFVSFWSLRTL